MGGAIKMPSPALTAPIKAFPPSLLSWDIGLSWRSHIPEPTPAVQRAEGHLSNAMRLSPRDPLLGKWYNILG